MSVHALHTAPVDGCAECAEDALETLIADCYHDPLAFVMAAFPWGEPGGPLEHDQPEPWQREVLTRLGQETRARGFNGRDAVLPIRMAISAGHGAGKSVLAAWIVLWIMATRPDAKGTVTANTFAQLETKTWAAIQTWHKRSLCAHWFHCSSQSLYRKGAKESWAVTAISNDETNAEAFAGQHTAKSTSFYLFDEASAIGPLIHETAEGGLAKGEPMFFMLGNATRAGGKFYGAVFGDQRDRWLHWTIDASTCTYANQQLIDEWRTDYGEDSDFFRVRVKGLAPSAGDAQFIDAGRIYAAQRAPATSLPDDPLICGVDVPDKGPAWFVARFRRGRDARTIPPIRIPGDASPDFRARCIGVLAERLRDPNPATRVDYMFIDSAFGAPIAERLQAMGFTNVHEIRFGAPSPDSQSANQRAYQWGRLKDALGAGLAIPREDKRLEADLGGPGYALNKQDRLVLESKESMAKRNVASPDDGDALSLTYARPVALLRPEMREAPYRPASAWG